jgi:O-antigen ligase
MRYLLTLPIIVYTIGDTFRLPLSLGPGLSLKNGILYLVGLMLALRMVLRGNFRFELPTIHICFAILIGYAISSMLIAGLTIGYDDYEVVDSAITLKSKLIDNAIILGLFFYGTRSIKDVLFLTKATVAAVTVANIICIASILGYLDLPDVAATPEEGGRVSGPFGHPNATAAVIAALIPAYVAIAQSSRGFWPLVWIAGAISSLAMLVMTASRGALVAMAVGYPAAAYVLRRYVSLRRGLLWAGAVVMLGAVVLSLLGTHFIALFLERIVTESGASDVGALSSGRSEFWTRAVGKMMATPVTLITGFGWNAYDTMGFPYAAHNQYLLEWFELGLVGVGTFVVLLFRTLSTVRSAIDGADPLSRGYLIAFVFGFGAFLIALLFGDMVLPWTYVWAYAGVSLRLALITTEARTSATASSPGGKEIRGADMGNRDLVTGKFTIPARRLARRQNRGARENAAPFR